MKGSITRRGKRSWRVKFDLQRGDDGARRTAYKTVAGARKDAYLQARRALGITKEVVCLQQTPHGDFVVVYIEARDTSVILQNMIDANDMMDCPPSLGLLTLNSLTAAKSVLIPMQCEYYSLQGLSHLMRTC